MTKREFAQMVAMMVEGEVKEVNKANGVVLTGIMPPVPEGWNSVPVVYIDDAYERGETVEETAKEVMNILNKEGDITMNMKEITNYEAIKNKLRARLYNKATVAEVYEDANNYGFPDLIIVPYIENIVEHGSARVTQALLDEWGISVRELINTAISNIKLNISDITATLGMMGIDVSSETPSGMMYVISNTDNFYGAGSVLKAKEYLAEKFPEGYYIIPSSVHEVLAISRNAGGVTELIDMVKSVNEMCVAPEERLADNVYKF